MTTTTRTTHDHDRPNHKPRNSPNTDTQPEAKITLSKHQRLRFRKEGEQPRQAEQDEADTQAMDGCVDDVRKEHEGKVPELPSEKPARRPKPRLPAPKARLSLSHSYSHGCASCDIPVCHGEPDSTPGNSALQPLEAMMGADGFVDAYFLWRRGIMHDGELNVIDNIDGSQKDKFISRLGGPRIC